MANVYCRKKRILLQCYLKSGCYQHSRHRKCNFLWIEIQERSDTINFKAQGGLSGKLDFSSLLLATRGESKVDVAAASLKHVNNIPNSVPYEKARRRVLLSDEISCCLSFGMRNLAVKRWHQWKTFSNQMTWYKWKKAQALSATCNKEKYWQRGLLDLGYCSELLIELAQMYWQLTCTVLGRRGNMRWAEYNLFSRCGGIWRRA